MFDLFGRLIILCCSRSSLPDGHREREGEKNSRPVLKEPKQEPPPAEVKSEAEEVAPEVKTKVASADVKTKEKANEYGGKNKPDTIPAESKGSNKMVDTEKKSEKIPAGKTEKEKAVSPDDIVVKDEKSKEEISPKSEASTANSDRPATLTDKTVSPAVDGALSADKPELTENKSTSVGNKSDSATVKPASPAEKSEAAAVKPASPAEKSDSAAVKPASPAEKSDATVVKPVSPAEKSTTSTETIVAAPVETQAASGETNNVPVLTNVVTAVEKPTPPAETPPASADTTVKSPTTSSPSVSVTTSPAAPAPPKVTTSGTTRNDKLVPLKKRGLESPVEFLTNTTRQETGESEAKMAKTREEEEEVKEHVMVVEGRGEGAANTALPALRGRAVAGPPPAVEEFVFRYGGLSRCTILYNMCTRAGRLQFFRGGGGEGVKM